MKISPAVKVGILTIISLIILTFGILWLKGRAISAGQRIDVSFKDVDGMRPGSAVQMMGIRIGQVEEVLPILDNENSYVKVKFVITEPGIDIPKASEISIQQSGIIGEKFLEITPPQIQIIYMPIIPNNNKNIHSEDPVEMLVSGNYIDIGTVKLVEVVNTKILTFSQQAELGSQYAYKIGYIVTMPGLTVPDLPSYDLIKNKDKGFKLRLTPPENIIVQMPEVSSEYTIKEPVRLKDFLDLQLKAAYSLNETNERINTMMTGETIQDLKITLKNIKNLSAKANDTLDKTAILLDSSSKELDSVIAMATKLTEKVVVLTDNVNGIVGDPEFKNTLISTTKSVNESTKKMSKILSDSQTQQTLANINATTKNLADISSYLNDMTQDKALKGKFAETLVNLNVSMQQLSASLETVKGLTDDQEKNIKTIMNDTAQTAKNLKEFSEKLNKRFLLFRLAF